jgi:hypothetical protein
MTLFAPTHNTPPETGVENPRPVGSYYYDDATGYEIYDPAQDEEEENDVNPVISDS